MSLKKEIFEYLDNLTDEQLYDDRLIANGSFTGSEPVFELNGNPYYDFWFELYYYESSGLLASVREVEGMKSLETVCESEEWSDLKDTVLNEYIMKRRRNKRLKKLLS